MESAFRITGKDRHIIVWLESFNIFNVSIEFSTVQDSGAAASPS
jgi:hypothetical protein